jgi:hypothetical protein
MLWGKGKRSSGMAIGCINKGNGKRIWGKKERLMHERDRGKEERG